jgi:hypothetical protein
MWAFSGWTAALVTVISTAVGALVWLVLGHLSSGQVTQHYISISGKGLAGFGFGGALLSFLAALVSLAFWLLFGTRPGHFIWMIFHMIIVTGAGVLGIYAGFWIAGRFLRKF